MMNTRRVAAFIGALCILTALVGCGTMRETLPARSAMEQLLVSTAADRAIEKMPADGIEGKRVFVDASNLECYDKPYVVQRIRQTVLDNDGRLAENRQDAQVVLEVASGGLSINRRDYLLGLPSIPLPIPFAGETLKLPELPIFKVIFYRGKAKLLFNAIDPTTNSQLYELPVCYGKSLDSFWWILLFGPFERSDLPKGLK